MNVFNFVKYGIDKKEKNLLFENGLTVVTQDNKYGYADKKGKLNLSRKDAIPAPAKKEDKKKEETE